MFLAPWNPRFGVWRAEPDIWPCASGKSGGERTMDQEAEASLDDLEANEDGVAETSGDAGKTVSYPVTLSPS